MPSISEDYLLKDVIRATNFPGNPPCTSGSATIAMKPANMMQAIGCALRQESSSNVSTANEQSSRQSVVSAVEFERARGVMLLRAEFGKEPTADTDKGSFASLDEPGKDKTLLLIIPFL